MHVCIRLLVRWGQLHSSTILLHSSTILSVTQQYDIVSYTAVRYSVTQQYGIVSYI